tara:strand:+ start:5624 stop:6865 length:1242 start_codon:yes stop_codon:yes gene_type:complete
MIGLLDCNNFFVSCERLFRPDLWNKPVAVLSSNDGCIVARSQEVKDMGIPMGVPHFQVKDICTKESVTLFSGNLTLYRDISARVMQVLLEEVGACEIYSIDEAFFTLPDTVTVDEIKRIRDLVMQKVGVPVSVGVARSKTLAKIASGIGKKEDGFYILRQKDWENRAKDTKCGTVWGLGRQTTKKLNEIGIRNVSQFMALPNAVVRQNFNIGTQRIYTELCGTPVFGVDQNSESVRQSIASTRSFAHTTTDIADLESAVANHVTHVAEKLRERNMCTTHLSVHIQTDRFGDFFMQSASGEIVLPEPTAQTAVLLKYALEKVRILYKQDVPYKKAGVTVSSLMPASYITQDLFTQTVTETISKLDEVTDAINQKFGKGVLRSGAILERAVKSNAKLRSPNYTTVWKDIPVVGAK